jgi:hypothetical protein
MSKTVGDDDETALSHGKGVGKLAAGVEDLDRQVVRATASRAGWTRWVAGATMLLAVATTLSVAVLALQLREFRKTDETLKADQRSWVGWGDFAISRFDTEPDVHIVAHATIGDFGKGPALKVFAMTTVLTGVRPPEEVRYSAAGQTVCRQAFDVSTGKLWEGEGTRAGFALFPGQSRQVTFLFDPPPGSVEGPIRSVVFIGCVSYEDQFGKLHWTRVCMETEPSWVGPVARQTPIAPCLLANDTEASASGAGE